MSTFVFKARKPTGEFYSGEKEATDRYDLYRLLRENGDEIIQFKEKKSGMAKFNTNIPLPFLNRVKMAEKINFARNLGAMIEAGLALSRALAVLERQSRNKAFKKILTELIEEIGKGTPFSSALEKFPKVFPAIFVSMVHAGEQSGTLAESLKVIAGQLETTHNLEKKVKGSMMYPSVILCVMILVGVLMMIFVVPTLLKTFTEMNVELPFTTKMILFASDAIRYNGPIMAAVLVLVAGSLFYASKTKTGKSLIQKSYLKIPIIGGLVQEVNTARTARTLSSLLTSGVGVVESVNIASTVVQNVHFKKVLESAAESIKKGDLMSKTFGEHVELYPVFFVEMLSVGEETGKIGEMLMGVAHYFEEDVDRKTKDMSTIIEPFLIVLIGAAVGFFAVAMIMPMYSLVDVIN